MVNLLPRTTDQLGLRAALADWLLPVLVAAMSFLAALAIGGTLASAALANHWQGDTAAALTIQVPDPASPANGGSATRLNAVLAILQTAPGVTNPAVMSPEEVNKLLTPWLGADAAQLALPIPAVITATWVGPGTPDTLPDALAPALQKPAPGTLVTTGAAWAQRVTALTDSLQACAAAVLVIVALVATAVVAVATHSGLAQRRETIEIIHGLGALDADIADRFAGRATVLTIAGAAGGALVALPVLLWLATLAAPFAGPVPSSGLANLPPSLWIALPALPVIAAAIGWSTAQLTVRGWLRNLA